MTRIESERQELAEMYREKRNIQLENIDNMLEEWALSPQEAEEALISASSCLSDSIRVIRDSISSSLAVIFSSNVFLGPRAIFTSLPS